MDEYWDGDAGRYRKVLARNVYRYDKAGNCVEKATLLGKTKFIYDSLNRLAEASYPEGRREYYTYDKADNRLTMTTDTLLETYTYDSASRLTERSIHDLAENGQTAYGQPEIPAADRIYQYTYDRQGNTLSDGENTYTYDSLNRLTQINTKAGGIQKNRYDGEGLRAELEENGRLVQFLFHNGEVVLEEPTEGAVTRYIRGYDLISSDSAAAKTYYHYTSDNLGSITHITDEDGNICNQYEYDAFGSFAIKEETIQNRFCYTGEQYDPITSQYYLRARFYNPVIGRFLNEDTYYGDGLNLYAYCDNNPVNYVDPSGHYDCTIKKMGKRGHIATWEHLNRNGVMIDSGIEHSGGTKPGRILTWAEQLKTHTEYKILEALKKKGTVSQGDTIIIYGTRPPCNPGRSKRPSRGCQKEMQDFANNYKVNILYFKEGDPMPWVFPR